MYSRASSGTKTALTAGIIYRDLYSPIGERVYGKQLSIIKDAIKDMTDHHYIDIYTTEELRPNKAFEYKFTNSLFDEIRQGRTRYTTISFGTYKKIFTSNHESIVSKDILYKLYLAIHNQMVIQTRARDSSKVSGLFYYSSLAKRTGHHRITVAAAVRELEQIGVFSVDGSHNEKCDKIKIVDLTSHIYRRKAAPPDSGHQYR